MAIACVGFGYEATELASSYWHPPPNIATDTLSDSAIDIFISGNGDGALVDFVHAGLNGNSISEYYDAVDGIHVSQKDLLIQLEKKFRADQSIDIFNEYNKFIDIASFNNIMRKMANNLRRDARIFLHARDARFKLESAIINRLCAFLVIKTFESLNPNNLVLLEGPIDGRLPYPNPIKIGGRRYRPHVRLLRFGPDGNPVRRAFLENSVGLTSSLHRGFSASPRLNSEAVTWLASKLQTEPLGTTASSTEPLNRAATVTLPKAEDYSHLIRLFFDCKSNKYIDNSIKHEISELEFTKKINIQTGIIVRECFELVLLAKFNADLNNNTWDKYTLAPSESFIRSKRKLSNEEGNRRPDLVDLEASLIRPSRYVLNGGSLKDNAAKWEELLDFTQSRRKSKLTQKPFAMCPAIQPAAAAAILIAMEKLGLPRESADIVEFNAS